MKVLFVCTGNINRSAAAETIFNSMGLGEARSCGTGKVAFSGKGKMTAKTIKALASIGTVTNKRRALPISEELLAWADIVVTMGNPHVKYIMENFPQYFSKVTRWDVADPHFHKGDEFHREVVGELKELISLHFAPQ